MNKDHDRFWSKVDKQFLGCWLWNQKIGKNGYASFHAKGKTTTAHRYSYQIFFGKVQDNLHIDHICRTRHCVNPDHLEAVTVKENVVERSMGLTGFNSRKTKCKKGHELSGDNLKILKSNGKESRRCITCVNDEQRERWRKNNPYAITRKLKSKVYKNA